MPQPKSQTRASRRRASAPGTSASDAKTRCLRSRREAHRRPPAENRPPARGEATGADGGSGARASSSAARSATYARWTRSLMPVTDVPATVAACACDRPEVFTRLEHLPLRLAQPVVGGRQALADLTRREQLFAARDRSRNLRFRLELVFIPHIAITPRRVFRPTSNINRRAIASAHGKTSAPALNVPRAACICRNVCWMMSSTRVVPRT